MDCYKKEILSPTLKIVTMMIEYPEIYKSINISSLQEFQPSQSNEYPDGNNINNIYVNNNINKYKNYNNLIRKDNDKMNKYNDKYNKNININQMSKSGEIFPTLSYDASQENLMYDKNLHHNNTQRIINKEQTPLRNKEIFLYNTDDKTSKTNPRNYKRNNMNNNYIENNNLNNQSEYISQQELNNNISNLYLNVPTDNSNKNNIELNNIKTPTNQIPIDLRFKSEKRIYRQHSRQKSKDKFNENNEMILSNNNIDLMSSSEGENDLKFKPSYQIQNNIDNNRRNNYNIFQIKNDNNNKTKNILNPHRVYNEDFLNDDYNYKKK
jgi:hypothetical protein